MLTESPAEGCSMYKISETGMRTERKTIKLDILNLLGGTGSGIRMRAHMEVAKRALNL